MLDWKNVLFSNKSRKKVVISWPPCPIGLVKLNFDGCFLGNLSQMGIGGVIKDHFWYNVERFL